MSRSKKNLLAGASAAVFALAIGSSAFALPPGADIVIPDVTGTSAAVIAHTVVNNAQVSTGGSSTANTGGASHLLTATGTGNTNTVTANLIAAIAQGNTVADSVPLNATGSGSGNGIGILSVASNVGHLVQSAAEGDVVAAQLTDFVDGAAIVTSNTIQATSTLNGSSVTITPTAIPLAFASASTGGSLFQFPSAPLFQSQGDLAVANAQLNANSGSGSDSGALSGENQVTLEIGQDASSTGNHDVAAASTVADNTVSATFTGNLAATSLGVGAGGQPAYEGSASLTNLQVNQDVGSGDHFSAGTFGIIGANISGDATAASAATETLVGTLAVTGNTVSSTAAGNTALSTTGAGNSISIANGVSFADPAGQGQSNLVDLNGATTVLTEGGLSLFNGQFNDRTSGTDQVPYLAVTSGFIAANVENAVGATVDVNTNQVTASGTGNSASNAISAGGANSATIDGSASLTSLQQTNHSLVGGVVEGGLMIANVGDAAGNGTVDGSVVSVSADTVSATAYGNNVTNSVGLAGQTIASGAVPGTITRLTAQLSLSGPTYDATSDGSTLVSVQGIGGNRAQIESVAVEVAAQLIAGYGATLSGDTLSVDNNELQAISIGNSGASTIGATGGSFTGTLGLLSGQYDSAGVSADLTEAAANLIVTDHGGAVETSSLSNSGNILRALAYANQITGNDIAVAVSSLVVEGVTSKGAEIVVRPGDANGLPFDDSGRPAPLVIAGLALLNDQVTTAGAADVEASATTTESAVLLSVGDLSGGDLAGSTAAADSNAFVAAARGNVASNGATITAQTLSVGPTGFDPVASVTNIQTLIGGSDVRATADTSDTGNPATASAAIPTVELSVGGNLNDSTVSAGANQVSAVAEGNTSLNTLTVSAGSLIAAWTTPFPLYVSGAAYTGTMTNDAAFTVTNAQASTTGSRGAMVADDGVSIDIGADVITSTAKADTNQLYANASDNTATNTIGIAATTFQASASVQSLQLSSASLFANQGAADTGVAITAGGDLVANSVLDASRNTYSATGTANTATNQVSVTAGIASGAVGPVPPSHQGARYSDPIYSSATGDLTLQNTQQQSGDTESSSNAVTSINVASPVTGGLDAVRSSVETLNSNQNQATAQGNFATNGIALAVNNSSSETAALVSDQTSTAPSSTTSSAVSAVLADLLVSDSTVTESENVNLALTGLNTASNTLAAGGAGASLGQGYDAAGALVNGDVGALADFSVLNVQTDAADSRLDAAATFTVGNSDVAGSVFGSSGSVIGSTLTLANNSNAAEATVNRATSTLTLNPGASLGASGGLQNVQSLAAPFVTAEATTVYGVTEPNFAGSTVSLTGDASSAQALGNVASNTVSASGVSATLFSTDLLEQGAAAIGYNQAIGDYALGNVQTSDGEFGSANHVLFSVATTVPTQDVNVLTAGSAIRVSGNSAQSASEANTAVNILKLAVTDAANAGGDSHAATAALYSLQEHVGSVASNSTETIEAIGMVTASTVDMSNNSNLALSVGNDVSNLVQAAADANFEAAANSWVTDVAQANGITTGDVVLSNAQFGDSATAAIATTTIEQSDTVPLTGTTTTRDSTVTVNGNTTFAEADQNRASNTVTLNAGANNGGLAAVSNTQSSSGSVSAQVTATISYSEPNATASSFSMSGNSTVAQATGNTAVNALNASAGAQFVVPAGAQASTNNNGDTSGQFAVLNNQSNSATISASNSTTMTVALNGPAFAGVVSNSGLSAQNNSVMAVATGNAATNSITLTGGSTGTSPAALSNFQQNSGSVTATITGSSISVTAGNPGGISGSNLTVAGNSIIARATGNSATNIITAR